MRRIMITILLLALAALSCTRQPVPSPEQVGTKSVVELLRRQRGGLTEWQKFMLAIIWTESKGNPAAVGKAGDSGVMQLREIYVAEVNRLYGTGYTIEDAFDIAKTLEMFDLLQDYYNPEHDIEKAIYYHNKSSAYKMKVLENLALVERMEAARRAVSR